MPDPKANRQIILTRRDFLKRAGVIAAVVTVGSAAACQSSQTPAVSEAPEPPPTQRDAGQDSLKQSSNMTRPESTHEVIIIGAGIAGLTAAYHLQDYDLKLLELFDRVGGRVISGSYEGFSYAKGTEYLGEPEGSLVEIIDTLNLQLKEIPAPMDAHFHKGRFYYGEDGIALMHIEESSLAEYNRFVAAMQEYYDEYEEIPDFNLESDLAELDNLTAEDWFDQHDFADSFYEAYNVTSKGLFGATLDEISALSAIPEIVFDFEEAEPIESVDELENNPHPTWERSESYSFVTGITELTEAIAQHLGNKIQLNAKVTGISQKDNQYLVTYVDEQEQAHTLAADVVILACPAPVTLKIAAEVLNQEQQEIIAQVPYAVYVTATLFSQEPIFDQAFDLAVPDGYFFTDIYDSTWVQRYYDESLEDKEIYITGIYVAPESYQDRSLLDMPDEQILENIYADLEKIFPGAKEKVVGYDIQRFPYAYPIMTLGAYQRLTRLHEITNGSLLLAGDYMIYPTFEAAADSGYLAAQKARDELA